MTTKKAKTNTDRQEPIVLSERDFAKLVALIENPPQPTPQLVQALRESLYDDCLTPEAVLSAISHTKKDE